MVSGDLRVGADNQIVVENGGSFIMTNNYAVIDMPNPASFTYIRTSAVMKNNDFTYWSAPVEGVKVQDLGSAYVYSFDTSKFTDLYSGNGYPQTTGSPDGFDDDGNDWFYENPANILSAGKGYAVMKPGSGNTQTIAFSGIPHNGFISVPVSLSGNDNNDEDDWNLIGNPYPSAIDAKVLINSNINISGTLYYWTHNTDPGSGSNTGPDYSNYNPDDYASFNLSGGVAAGTGGEIPNGYIAAGQGFFMDVKDNGIISFNNDMRVSNITDENTQFYKSSKVKSNADIENSETNKIWLNFSNEKGAFGQTLIAFVPGATNTYEPAFDGVLYGVGLKTKFYSILDDKNLSIQGRSVLNNDTQIPLGIAVNKADNFNISVHKIIGKISDETISVLLEDTERHIIHDLKKGSYHFNVTNPGTYNNRFKLHITGTALSASNFYPNNSGLRIAQSDEHFILKAPKAIKSVFVYDLMGRLLQHSKPKKDFVQLDKTGFSKASVLIFKVELDGGTILTKKMMRL